MSHTDISTFYDSIYTHSIVWALHGKDNTKKLKFNIKTKQKLNKLGDEIDTIFQSMSYGETHGIPQGNIISDFIAEILLGYLDVCVFYSLRKKHLDYKILREAAAKMGVPSLEENACTAITNLVSIKRPEKSIDIGCGIGVSSYAILKGFPATNLTAIDSNLERGLFFQNHFKDYKNVEYYQMRGEQYLKTCDKTFDFAFIDSVKREYFNIWQLLRPKLNKNACVVFDDILIYGFVMAEEAETPYKYQTNRKEVQNFISHIFSDTSLNAQIIPVNGGLLIISLK